MDDKEQDGACISYHAGSEEAVETLRTHSRYASEDFLERDAEKEESGIVEGLEFRVFRV